VLEAADLGEEFIREHRDVRLVARTEKGMLVARMEKGMLVAPTGRFADNPHDAGK